MEQLKKCRKVMRALFTRSANSLQTLLNDEVDLREIETAWCMLQERQLSLKEADKQVFDAYVTADVNEDVLTAELTSCEEYTNTFMRLNVQCSHILHPKEKFGTGRASSELQLTPSVEPCKLKLPAIEFKRFGGDVKDWLPFWTQFTKIHEDDNLVPEDKFQFLIQATIVGSRARELVESFPPTRDNYVKAIDSLKSRFGREDVLIEVYVRELLKIVLNNALSKGSKMALCTLYDRIETQLRALETLGITTDKCAAMLYPLVESCLPAELLRAWQRSSNFSSEHKPKNRLDSLIKFVKSEVESEERISLAVAGFGINTSEKTEEKIKKTKITESSIPTAAGLLSCEVRKCVFCDGAHANDDCFKARKMSFEEKRKILTEKQMCFRCLKIGHQSRKCRSKLSCILCSKPHAVIMCSQLPVNRKDAKQEKKIEETVNGFANCSDTHVFMQTMRVNLCNNHGEREIRVLIDTGSQCSYILKTTAEEFKYPVLRRKKIIHALFGGVNTNEQEHCCYNVQLVSLDKKYVCKLDVLDQPLICGRISSVFQGPWLNELHKLNIKLTDLKDSDPIELLIGADIVGKLLTGRRHILECGLVVVETLLGWTLMGKVPLSPTRSQTTMIVMSNFVKEMSVEELWKLDVLGITDPIEKRQKQELEAEAKELFDRTVCVNKERRYEVKMPWLECHPPLPTNYSIAKKRLDVTIKKLETDGRKDEYEKVFQNWLDEGIIEVVTEKETDNCVHYMPHRPVYKENSTTKVRPVFDASAKEKNAPSLNQCLEKGANLIELIPNIIWRFRREKIGVVADIEKAFLQISLQPKDRDVVRFLWKNRLGEEIIFRHKRVVFGVSCSPFLLGATIEHHLNKILKQCHDGGKFAQQVILKLQESFYVDNCVTSVSSKEELSQFMDESFCIMERGKFNLRGWEFSFDSNQDKITSVLGLLWNKNNDTLAVNTDCLGKLSFEVITKRIILSMAHHIFDPVGFTCPVTLLPKLLLQKLWEEKLNWDQEVGEEIQLKFRKWLQELTILSKIEIPRWINLEKETNQKYSLHTFCDASQTAYAAVFFIRVESEDNVAVNMIQAKTRVAPTKKLTIPRLELLAATIAARLYNSVKKEFSAEIESFFWCDSSTVLSWIKRTEEWSVFVRNRVQEIRELTSIESWRHIEGTINPADLPSRGCSARHLLESKWWEGPIWLYEPSENWPHSDSLLNEDEINLERRKKVISTIATSGDIPWYCKYFSKYQKIIRMVGWIKRFIHNSRYPGDKLTGELSAEEVESSQKTLFLLVQQESFNDVKLKEISSLNPVKGSDDLLRLKTRIVNRDDTNDFRFPILLPAQHPLVNRLIFDVHVRSCHVGVQALQSILREHYWILGGRRLLRTVINKCVRCQRYNAKRIEVSLPPLPHDRVKDAAVFEITGVDLAGPIFLKNKEKAWICLFTCGVYRAVHLELVTTLSTNNFIQALRRFIARRGRPKTIYSDNGTNFIGTNNALESLNWNEILRYSSVERITWRFNPPSAPWWGGWWERLIGILKRLLRRVLGKASVDYEEMVTILCDCENIVNSRPLTYVSENPQDLRPLTPSMYLRDLVEDGVPDCDAIDCSSLNRRIRYVQKLRVELRSRFRTEYLGQLKQSPGRRKILHKITVGDIVIIGNDSSKRLDWPLGRVVEVLPGKDGETRLVRVETKRGQLLRPVQRIYPLESVGNSNPVPESSSESAGVLKSRVPDNNSESAGVPKSRVPVVTKSGRVVRTPDKYVP